MASILSVDPRISVASSLKAKRNSVQNEVPGRTLVRERVLPSDSGIFLQETT